MKSPKPTRRNADLRFTLDENVGVYVAWISETDLGVLNDNSAVVATLAAAVYDQHPKLFDEWVRLCTKVVVETIKKDGGTVLSVTDVTDRPEDN
jgi:hypothetical protein